MGNFTLRDPLGSVTINGAERSHIVCIATDMLAMSLQCGDDEKDSPLTSVLPKDCFAIQGRYIVGTHLRTWLYPSTTLHIKVDGRNVDLFTLAINTLVTTGNDPVIFLARLHSQCEYHCYVEGANRQWLASIIEQGRRLGIMRRDMGWEDAIRLLRTDWDMPAVFSYSDHDDFPSARAMMLVDGHAADFEAMSSIQRWATCMGFIREPNKALELKPDGWRDWRAGTGLNGYEVRDWAERHTGQSPECCG